MSEFNRGDGDAAGRRLARQRAAAAEEACRVAECLAMAMRRVGLDDSQANDIAESLRRTSTDLLRKAEGHISPRTTTRATGHPLLEGRPITSLYLDESGSASFGDPCSTFALGGIAIREESVGDYIAAADEIKRQFFGHTAITFHEPLMRTHKAQFWFKGDKARQSEFDYAIARLLDETPFTVFGAGIRKDAFATEFVETRCDPYLPTKVYDLAIMLVMERFVDYLGYHQERRMGRVHLESIGAGEDAEHQSAYSDLMVHGTQFVSDRSFQGWVEAGCRFSPKSGSNPAELADLVAREVFEWTRDGCVTSPRWWEVLSSKIYLRADGHFGKFGVKVFPETDIWDAVMAHRAACGAGPRN